MSWCKTGKQHKRLFATDIKTKLHNTKDIWYHLVAVHKINTILTFSKPAYVKICKLELNKGPVHEFHFDYIKIKYEKKSRILFTYTNSFLYEIKTKNVYDKFINKKMFDFSNYFVKSKHYDDSDTVVFGKVKDKMGGVTTDFVG